MSYLGNDFVHYSFTIHSKSLHVYGFLTLIGKTENIFDVATFRLLYNAFVYSSLIYRVTVWGNASNVCLCNAITNQKIFLRLMFGADLRAHCVEFFSGKLTHYPLLNYIVISLWFLKSLKGAEGADIYQVYSGAYNARLNSQGGLAVPFVITNLYKRTIRVDAEIRWIVF